MPRSVRQFAREASRSPAGLLLPVDALTRFASKCAFDPVTGCVMWTGTTTHGKGRTEPYGYFWYEGRMVLAHRWAAEHVHGFEIEGKEVDHCCPAGPSTLCVQHLAPEPGEVNRALRHERTSRTFQSLATRRYWLFVSLGIEESPRPAEREDDGVPFHPVPSWLQPFMPVSEILDDCPF